MIEISFSAPRRQDGELGWDRVAVLRVDGTHFEIEGDQDMPKCATSRSSTSSRARR
jgi:hypothetical protein